MTSTRSFLFTAMVALLALAACAPVPTRPPVADPEAAWSRHRAAVGQVNDWHLNGNLAVAAHGDGGQARVDWRQRNGAFDIRLSGPLGSGAVRLSGDDGGATLALDNGERHRNSDASWLLYQQTGWWIPVEALRWWALGLPAPDAPAQLALDDQGRLARLVQNGWTIRFDRYVAERGIDVPGRLVASAEDAEVRLVVRRWELSRSGPVAAHGG